LGSAAARADQRHRLGQDVAPLHTGHGRGTDRSCVDLARSPALSRAAVAAASGEVSTRWWWEAARGGDLSERGAFTRLASKASPGLRGRLGGHESPLV
jgi:hypothetical protein